MNLDKKKSSNEIFQHWVHSYEDDKLDIKVYRTTDYPFPRSRGRLGFELKKDGTFIFYDISKEDLPKKVFGYWKFDDENKIRLSIEGKNTENILDIISCDKNILQVKKHGEGIFY